MSISPTDFVSLFETLRQIDLFGKAGNKPPSFEEADGLIKRGAANIPPVLNAAYTTPLSANLRRALSAVGQDATTLETILGAIYQHEPAFATAAPAALNRLLAVISDLYRSFLSKRKRAAADFPLLETLPPLAMFQHDGSSGPFTIPCDDIKSLFQGEIGVVSLPAIYADHPFLWTSLAHETGGHDVTHADEELLPELIEGAQAFFGGGPISDPQNLTQAQLMGALWGYWMDEAAADVYGTLNAGPQFGLNLIAFFAALNAQIEGAPATPMLRAASGFDAKDPNEALDVHPTDLLRPYLIAGVVDTMQNLPAAKRQQYVADLNSLAIQCSNGASEIEIVGFIHSAQGVRIPVQSNLPLEQMKLAARQVGGFIASAKLTALGGHAIQEIETWDDMDETTAQRVADNLLNGDSISGLGDDAQLLAGATLAAFRDPTQYKNINEELGTALDFSFASDPIWGVPKPDPVFLREMSFKFKRRDKAKPAGEEKPKQSESAKAGMR